MISCLACELLSADYKDPVLSLRSVILAIFGFQLSWSPKSKLLSSRTPSITIQQRFSFFFLEGTNVALPSMEMKTRETVHRERDLLFVFRKTDNGDIFKAHRGPVSTVRNWGLWFRKPNARLQEECCHCHHNRMHLAQSRRAKSATNSEHKRRSRLYFVATVNARRLNHEHGALLRFDFFSFFYSNSCNIVFDIFWIDSTFWKV